MEAAQPRGKDLEARLAGTRRGRILQEFFTNSAHFPLANILFELLSPGGLDNLFEFDMYFILLGAALQAWYLGSRAHVGRPRPLLGNLIGPAFYTAVEFPLEGAQFFALPNHLAYWGFALAIGVLQAWRLRVSSGPGRATLVLSEHVVRTSILLGTYWIFEALDRPEYASLSGFLGDGSHRFVFAVIPLLGLVVGFANVVADRTLTVLQDTAAELRRFSEWFLGAELLERAMVDPAELSLRRRERAVVFMDIRGFTAWSETRPPEQVVGLVNGYFETAMAVLQHVQVLKVELTGDEILAVLPDVSSAAAAALDMLEAVTPLLAAQGLGAGTGINLGPLTEGLVGSRHVKKFSVMGDTVNTGKRICDVAKPGEVLLSETAYRALGSRVKVGAPRRATAKGKSDPLRVYPLDTLLSRAS